MAAGKHPFPFRTRKLSPPAPMVLGGRPPGRVGRRRVFSKMTPAHRGGRHRVRQVSQGPAGSVTPSNDRTSSGRSAAASRDATNKASPLDPPDARRCAVPSRGASGRPASGRSGRPDLRGAGGKSRTESRGSSASGGPKPRSNAGRGRPEPRAGTGKPDSGRSGYGKPERGRSGGRPDAAGYRRAGPTRAARRPRSIRRRARASERTAGRTRPGAAVAGDLQRVEQADLAQRRRAQPDAAAASSIRALATAPAVRRRSRSRRRSARRFVVCGGVAASLGRRSRARSSGRGRARKRSGDPFAPPKPASSSERCRRARRDSRAPGARARGRGVQLRSRT